LGLQAKIHTGRKLFTTQSINAFQRICIAYYMELLGVVDAKSPSWAKHVVRRWKQFYQEIQYADGQLDMANPLSLIFHREILPQKATKQTAEDGSPSPELLPSKKKESIKSQPQKTPSKTKHKQNKGRFFSKLKEIQCLLNPHPFF
jgi:hypothetical protein